MAEQSALTYTGEIQHRSRDDLYISLSGGGYQKLSMTKPVMMMAFFCNALELPFETLVTQVGTATMEDLVANLKGKEVIKNMDSGA